MKQHPLSQLFPPMSGNQFALFKADIQFNGQQDSIVIHEGMILDGCNRYKACTELDVEPKFTDYEGDDPFSFVMSSNLARRHLSESQRAMVGARIANLDSGVGHQQGKSADRRTLSQPEAAAQVGTSERMVSRAKKVQREGSARLIEVVDAAIIPIDGAMKLLNADDADEIIDYIENSPLGKWPTVNAAIKAVRKEEKMVAREPIAGFTPLNSYQLHCSSVADAHTLVEAESIDWIITDPPYPKEYIGTYDDLALFAKHALKPGGSLIVMNGQSYLPEIIQKLGEQLNYHWCCAYLTPGGQAPHLFARKVNTFWKPLLWYVKGKYEGDTVGDVCKSEVNDNDKSLHHWGQSVSGMADIVDRFTHAGDSVFDPFLGAGTTAMACLLQGRIFSGSDISQEEVDKSEDRIQETFNE